ncbi:hypothetical protein A5798_001109 [Enterococcus sp. 6C8_DIV0013]|nr:hypothetical protein A5798_001109 [Enterococcus sp. 6C8_DIV0013]
MNKLTVEELQSYLGNKYKETGITESLFMKLVEEIGEVAEVLNKIDGRKKNSTDHNLAFELADVIHYTFAIAALNNIDSVSYTHLDVYKRQIIINLQKTCYR